MSIKLSIYSTLFLAYTIYCTFLDITRLANDNGTLEICQVLQEPDFRLFGAIVKHIIPRNP